MDSHLILGLKVKPGSIERHKIENFSLDNTVINLKLEAEKKANLPSDSLELIHHGKILKDDATLANCGVKYGEMVHVVKKKVETRPDPPQTFGEADIQQLVSVLRSFGSTPTSPGWTRAMQALNEDSTMEEITTAVPSLADDCVSLSLLHEAELLAALGAPQTMRRAATQRPALPAALLLLARQLRSRNTAPSLNSSAPTSGYAYSLEALSDDDEGDDDDLAASGSQSRITREQVAAALAAAASTSGLSRNSSSDLLQYLSGSGTPPTTASDAEPGSRAGSASRMIITPDMFSSALTHAVSATNTSTPAGDAAAEPAAVSPAWDSTGGVTGSGATLGSFATQLQRMQEMGLLDERVNIRALLVSGGDVNAAINLVLSGAMED